MKPIDRSPRLRGDGETFVPATDILLTEHELAARHGRSVKTIRNLRVTGGYVPFLKIGRHVRYRLIDVLAYEERSLRQSTSDKGGPDTNE
ncbi:hypothetical protein DES32_1889 [Methylovirgula ligni]|uniref:Helix-turn-helix protein n=1 Tax=Methylovirgula ligni TaxID=569860 RepID=A0A3D9YWA9_9HYPH|nr:hypothetical protein DES32_1889 [Methylovirgula ligni]